VSVLYAKLQAQAKVQSSVLVLVTITKNAGDEHRKNTDENEQLLHQIDVWALVVKNTSPCLLPLSTGTSNRSFTSKGLRI
jgi:hypothetical protein